MSKIDEGVSEDEKQLELEGAKQLKEEEVRASVIEDFGFDAEADKEKIEKLTGERMTSHKKLSTAIGQKVKTRTKLQEALAAKGEGAAGAGEGAGDKGKTDTTTKEPVFSVRDSIALTKAKVDEEDIDDVLEYATFKKVSVAEALKSPILQATLKQKAEERTTAEATATGSKRTGTTKLSDEQLLENARQGILPETEEEANRLWRLRHKAKK